MPVLYGDFELRPVQNTSISITPRTSGDGRRVGQSITVQISGVIVVDMPDGELIPVDVESKLTTIFARQKAIREAFREPGKMLQLQGWDGGAPLLIPVSSTDITFDNSTNWVDQCRYSITVEGPSVAGEEEDTNFVESFSETWQFQEDETTRVTRATHSIQVKGQTKFDGVGGVEALAWENARAFALNKLKLGWEAIGDSAWSPKSGQEIAADSATFMSGTMAWNPIREENIGESDGTYSVTETLLLKDQAYWEERRYSVGKTDSDADHMLSVSVTGTIHGMFETPGDYDAKYTNALAGWAIVKAGIKSDCEGVVDGVTLTGPFGEIREEHDELAGTISYTCEFSDRDVVDGAFETHQVSMSTSYDDYKTTVQVSGAVRGVADFDVDDNTWDRLNKAKARWEVLRPYVYTWAVQGSGLNDLKLFPVSAQAAEDVASGSITFQFSFDNRLHAGIEEERTIDTRFSALDGQTTIGINGSIKGLRTTSPANPLTDADRAERLENASAYWAGIKENLLGLASAVVNTNAVNPNPAGTSVSLSESAGVISYNFEYNTRPTPPFPGALSASVTTTFNNSTKVFAEHLIPGRAAGPIFQPINTKTANRKTVSVEIVYPPSLTMLFDPPYTISLDAYAPQNFVYASDDSIVWSGDQNRLQVSKTWIY